MKTKLLLMRVLPFLCLLLLGPACDSADAPGDDPFSNIRVSDRISSSDSPDFGDAYVIATPSSQSADDEVTMPSLIDDVLTVWVSYSGGCENHEFTLGKTEGEDAVRLWFTHDGNSDFCEAYLTGKLVVDISEAVTDGIAVELLNPNGDPFSLR